MPPRIAAAFEFFDADQNGYIDATELRAALQHYGIKLDTSGVQRVLAAYDADQNAQLNLDEFHEVIRDAQRGFVMGDGRHKSRTGGSATKAATSAAASSAPR